MFAYGKSFTTSAFHVVHRDKDGNFGTTIAGSNDEQFANSDATDRTRRAKEMGLDCSHVVKARQDGHLCNPSLVDQERAKLAETESRA